MADILRLGNSCNQKCIFCTVSNDREKELTKKEAEEKIAYLAQNRCDGLTITGGEPTLNKDLESLIKFARKSGIKRIEVQTNGVKFSDKKFARSMVNAGLGYALVSLHSHKKHVSDKITQADGTFEKTITGIKNLQSLGVTVAVSHVINSLNHADLLTFVKFVRKNLKKDTILYFGFVRPNGRASDNKWIVPRISEIELDLYESLSFCQKEGIIFEVEGVPLCYMLGFYGANVETKRLKLSSARYVGSGDERQNIHEFINKNLKAKSSCCATCRLNPFCVGVWREYAELHSTDELYPIFDASGAFNG